MKTDKEQRKATATKGGTIKDTTPKHYTIIYKSVFSCQELTIEELGLLVKLLSLSPKFKLSIRGLASLYKTTTQHIQKITNGLQEKGFLKISKSGAKSTWEINQEGNLQTYYNNNFEELKELASHLRIQPDKIEELYKAGYISKNQAKELFNIYLKAFKNLTKEVYSDE